MADKEIMNTAELDAVVGGSGIECIAFLSRLKDEGLYDPKTPLSAGNEAAAAKELSSFLHSVKDRHGMNPFAFAEVYSDSRANSFGFGTVGKGWATADDAIEVIKDCRAGRM